MRSSFLKKKLDYIFGVPVLAALSFFKRKRGLPSCIQKIALLKSAAIGDTVLLSAVITDIRRCYPDANITLFCGTSNAVIADFLQGIDKIIVLSMSNVVADLKKIRVVKPDVLLDFGAWPRVNALYTLFSSAKYTVGFKTKGQYRHFGYDQYVIHSSALHEIDNYRQLIATINCVVLSSPSIYCSNSLPSGFESGKYIIFHLAAGGGQPEYRQWPLGHWKLLARQLEECNKSIYLTGAPTDKVLNQSLVSMCPGVFDISGNYSFGEILTILDNAALVVSVNTGIMHIAAILNTPTIGLSGPTNPHRWGPLGKKTVSITPDVPGCGYLDLGFEYKGQRTDCMRYITVEKVYRACISYL